MRTPTWKLHTHAYDLFQALKNVHCQVNSQTAPVIMELILNSKFSTTTEPYEKFETLDALISKAKSFGYALDEQAIHSVYICSMDRNFPLEKALIYKETQIGQTVLLEKVKDKIRSEFEKHKQHGNSIFAVRFNGSPTIEGTRT